MNENRNSIGSTGNINKARSAFFGVLWYFTSSLVPAFSSFIIFSLASRSIVPSELGAITLATTIATILTGFCAIGFGDALIQSKELKQKHVNTVFCLIFCTSVFFYLSSVIITQVVSIDSFNELFRDVYPLVSVKIILDSCAILPLSILTRTMSFKVIGLRTIYCSIGSFCVSIPVLLLGGGVWAIVFSQIISSIISFLVLWFGSKIRPRFRFDKDGFNELKSFGITTTFSKLVSSISVDNIVIGFVGNVATLGIYAFSRRIFSVVSDVLNGALSNVSYPVYSAIQDDLEKLKKVYMKTTFLSATVSLPSFLGLMLISPYIIPFIFGTQWDVAVVAIQFCCIIGFLACIGSLQMSLVKGLGKTSWILKYQIFQQVTTAIVSFVFAKYGAGYVTAAIAIKTYLIWPYTVFYISNLLNMKPSMYIINFYKPIIGTIFMFFTFKFIEHLFDSSYGVIFLIVEVLFCAFIYAGVLLVIAKKEILEVVRLIKR